MRLKVQPRFQIDRFGSRVRVGDVVAFHLDPEKPWKKESRGVVVRWYGACVATVRYPLLREPDAYDPNGDGPHLFDLGSHEITFVEQGPHSRMADKQFLEGDARPNTRPAR